MQCLTNCFLPALVHAGVWMDFTWAIVALNTSVLCHWLPCLFLSSKTNFEKIVRSKRNFTFFLSFFSPPFLPSSLPPFLPPFLPSLLAYSCGLKIVCIRRLLLAMLSCALVRLCSYVCFSTSTIMFVIYVYIMFVSKTEHKRKH